MNVTQNTFCAEKRRISAPIFSSFDKVLGPYIQLGICVAVSGGSDSLALLELLARWRKRTHAKLLVVACDHCGRSDSYAEAQRVLERAFSLGFETNLVKLYPSTSKNEAEFRRKRYEALWEIAKARGYAALCTAHHAGDCSEGYLLNLFGRGGGTNGAAMAQTSYFEGCSLLRPFVSFSKETLQLALRALNKDDYFEDPIDCVGIGQRARVRKFIIPRLQKEMPGLERRLSYLATMAKDDNDALLEIAREKMMERSGANIAVRYFKGAPKSLLRVALKDALAQVSTKFDQRNGLITLNRLIDSLDQPLGLVTMSPAGARLFNFAGAEAVVEENRIVIRGKQPKCN